MRYIMSETQTGRKHIRRNQSNQDAVFSMEDGKRCIIALADGAGSCSGAQLGAEEIVKRLSVWICSQFDDLKQLSLQEITKMLTGKIKEILRELSEKHRMNRLDFGSTYLFVCMDGVEYLAGHIGDGAILGLLENKYWSVMSFPKNGTTRRETPLTTSPYLNEHIRLQRGKIQQYQAFLLMTDGMTKAAFKSGYIPRYPLSYPELMQKSIRAQPHDDASYIYCERGNRHG